LYLVYIGLDDAAAAELNQLIDQHKENTTDTVLAMVATESFEQAKIIGFENDSGAMEFISFIDDATKRFKTVSKIKFALHAGVVSFPTLTMTGATIDHLKEIGTQISLGSICASGNFASILALSNKDYSLTYAGVIPSNGQKDTHPFYTIEKIR
jgi:hypothetical protein